jgi:rubrerythrin
MAPRQVIDFLHWAEAYHKRLHDFYEEKEHEALRPEVKALLQYMARHQDILRHVIEEYEKGSSQEVLEAWYKVSPDPKALESVDKTPFRTDMTINEVIDLALDLDRKLIEMYRMLLRDAESESLREVVENLLASEEQEEIRLLRAQLVS